MGLFDFLKSKNDVNKNEDGLDIEILKEDENGSLNNEEIIDEDLTSLKTAEEMVETGEIEVEAEEIPTEETEIEGIASDETETEEIITEEVNSNEGFFQKMFKGLSKTRDNIANSVDTVLKSFTKIDEEFYEELEDALILADLGAVTSSNIMEILRERVEREKIRDTSQIKDILVEEIAHILERDNEPLKLPSPTVILIIGVNGVGKTTTIGKLASKYKSQGKSVILAAGDTFRAAAIDQLALWGQRSNINVIKHEANSDPSAVIFDAVKSAKAKGVDVLICDTAGRLHNKKNLMDELKKMHKIISREYAEANVEVFLVLDGTTGQNALSQAKLFNEVAEISGIVLTKLDGTAKGGIVISIKSELNIPVRYVGFGEKAEDLGEFNATEFAKALFDTTD